MFPHVSDTAFARPVVPDVNMTTARASKSNTCAACSAKWMTLSAASCCATSLRRRSDARPELARPSAFVVRGSADAAFTRAAKLGRTPRPVARTADGAAISPVSMAFAPSNRRDTLVASTRNEASDTPGLRSMSSNRLYFSASVRRLLSATNAKPPYAAASMTSTYAGSFGRSTATQSPGRTPRSSKSRASAADSMRVSRYEYAVSLPASSTYVKHVRCGNCRTVLSNAPIIAVGFLPFGCRLPDVRSYGNLGNWVKSGARFSLNASRPSFASSVV